MPLGPLRTEKSGGGESFPVISPVPTHHQRSGRQSTFDRKPSSPLSAHSNQGDSTNGAICSPFKKSLFGDVFGTRSLGDARSMNGILYRARVHETMQTTTSEKSNSEGKKKAVNTKIGSATSTVDVVESESDSDNDVHNDMDSRLQLAMTLRNWAAIKENDDYFIREGGVHALIGLAGVDDPNVKKCVASALFHLSSRQENRLKLIRLGATTGVLSIAREAARSRKLAKLCATILCNLSMQPNGEADMQQHKAIIALELLIQHTGQRLIPLCVQALYNLTWNENSTAMERIIKILLNNIPSTGFDHLYYFVKALVNCCRSSSMRTRCIEFGAMNGLQAFIASIPKRENKDECVFLATTSLRLLSESTNQTVGPEMISKGCLDYLQMLLPLCSEQSRLLVVLTVLNLLYKDKENNIAIAGLSLNAYDAAVAVVTDTIEVTSHPTTLQYASCCLYNFTRDPVFHARTNAPAKIVRALTILLESCSSLTQYFAIAATGHIFYQPQR